jgi:hypothetical protein
MEFQVLEVAMAPAYMIRDIYFIFRTNGEEVEINSKSRNVTHQLSFMEIRFINDNYPYLEIEKYRIKTKIY